MIKELGKYYLYRHVRLDTNKVFYIGIGKVYDKFYMCPKNHYYRANIKINRNNHWSNIINKTNYIIEIMLESDDFDFIKEKEKEFIKLYGRKDLNLGTLVNMTDGGEGCNFSEERRRKLSLISILRNRDYSFKPILILNKTLEIIYEAKNAKYASLYIFNSKLYDKKIRNSCEKGFKINKNFYVIKKEDYLNNNINFKVVRKYQKSSRGNCKSFLYLNKFYETKHQLKKELNISRRKFDLMFLNLINKNLITWKK